MDARVIMPGVKAAIVAVGSELLSSDRLDTNSLRIAALFDEFGVALERKAQVTDDDAAIAAQIADFTRSCTLIVVTGGLGPTEDDRTRAALARLTGRALVPSLAVLAAIEARFRSFGRAMPGVNRRQAEVLEGAQVLANERGTAPGLLVAHAGATLFALPGVPYELDGFLAGALRDWLIEHADPQAGRVSVSVRTACLPESQVEELLAPVYRALGRDAIMVLAKPGEVSVTVHLPRAPADLQGRLESARTALIQALGDAVFDHGTGRSLEATVGELLLARGETVATAESCTGGLLGQRLTSVAGASRWYPGGMVTYSNALKQQLLGVSDEVLRAHGAVSEEVARSMAEGARARLSTDHALAITGIAGPDGGTPDKPVGTVHVALASRGEATEHRRLRLPGGREQVRWWSTQWALDALRRRLSGLPMLAPLVLPPVAAPAAGGAGGSGGAR